VLFGMGLKKKTDPLADRLTKLEERVSELEKRPQAERGETGAPGKKGETGEPGQKGSGFWS
jgi:hypothetical protein